VNLRFPVIAGLVMWVITSPSLAASGVVLFNPASCGFFLVETDSGFALMTSKSADDPDEGDILAGEFELRGVARVVNLTTDRQFEVWVEDYWLSEDDAIDLYLGYCE